MHNDRANINVKIRTTCRKKGGFLTHLASPRLSFLGTRYRCSISLHASKYRLCIHICISNSERSASIYRLTTIPVSQNNRIHVESKHDTGIKKSKNRHPNLNYNPANHQITQIAKSLCGITTCGTTCRSPGSQTTGQRCTGARVRGFERANVVAHALLRVGMI